MAIQVVTVKIQTDSSELVQAQAEARKLEQELELAEGSAEALAKQFAIQNKSLNDLLAEEKKLTKERNKSQDPKEILRLNKALKKTQKEIRTIKGEFKGASKEVQKMQSKGSKSMGMLGKAVGALGPIIAAAFSFSMIKDFIGATIEAAAKFEQTQVAFTTLLGGSSEAAQKLIKDLEKLSLATPLTPESLNQAAKTLLSFGIAQDSILPTLKNLGDVAQGDSEKLQQLSLVFGQISSAGKLMGQDLLQLINVGFNPLQTISEKTGRSVSDLKEDMSKGLITFADVEQAFQDATSAGGLFFGAMDAQSQTFSGRVSTLEGNVNKLKQQIGDELLPVAGQFVELLLAMTKNADKLGDEFEVLGFVLEGIFNLIVLLTEEEEENAAVTVGLAAAIKSIISPLDATRDAFNGLETDLRKVRASMEEIVELFNDFTGLDIATPFKDAADAAERLNERQKQNAKSVAFQTAALEKFKDVTGATDDEVSGFRKTLGEFSTEGKSQGQIFDELVVLMGEYKTATDTAEVSTNKLTKAQKENIEAAELWGDTYERQLERAQDVTNEGIAGILGDIDAFRSQSARGLIDNEEVMTEAEMTKTIYAETEEELTAILAENVAQRNELQDHEAQRRTERQMQAIELAMQVSNAIFALQEANNERNLNQNLERLNSQREQELANDNLTSEQKAAINEKFDKEQARLEEIGAKRQQQLAIRQAVIENALLVLRALATPPAPNFVAAGIAAVLGGFQIATIKAQQFADGGLVTGGTPGKDSVAAYLMPGERVMTVDTVKRYEPYLKAMHNGNFDPMNGHAQVEGLAQRMISSIALQRAFESGSGVDMRAELKETNKLLKGIKSKPQFILKGKEFAGSVYKRIGKNTSILKGL